MIGRGWAVVAAAGVLVTIPVVTWAAQDAPLAFVRVATFHGPQDCGSPLAPGRRGAPRCTYKAIDATVVVVDLKDGRTVARVRTHADGRGSATLPAGEYELRPARARGLLAAPPPPTRVKLEPAGRADVIVDYDPGDR